jgi:pseudaminic acid biosynthesis-associated methylase
LKKPMYKTYQTEKWKGEFGQAYTKRNPYTVEDTNNLYKRLYGVTRIEMNSEFISFMHPSIYILEVGSNVGAQLLIQQMGFQNLYGLEIQFEAIKFSKSISKKIHIIQGTASNIPFKDSFFDLIFTSGLLIHISPYDIRGVMTEVYRCSSRYIWGFEYFAEEYTEIDYRGEKNLLWKANFAQMYMDLFQNLKLIKEKKFPYIKNNNLDQMFLLEKI